MIPKIIHYVWCGDKPKPESVLKYIESWRKNCPDFEIKEWGNEILSELDNAYVKQAFAAKKWAFVSDYVRLYVLEKFGGIYLDTDVELTQPLTPFLNHDFVLGAENYKNNFNIGTAFIGTIPHHQMIKDLLAIYDHLKFDLGNGQFDMTPNPQRFNQYFKNNHDLKNLGNGDKVTEITKNCFLYPWWYFCLPLADQPNYAIHHFDGSWLELWKRKNIFQFNLGRHYLVISKFKKRHNSPAPLPLLENERLLLGFTLFKKTFTTTIIRKKIRTSA